jgi:hypothetical protein
MMKIRGWNDFHKGGIFQNILMGVQRVMSV